MSARRKSSALDRNRIAREDVLRFLLEEGGSAGIDEVRAELSSSEVADEAIADLRGSGLLIVNGDRISLTDKGRLRALEVYRRHISIEGVLGKLLAGEKVHEATHYLEHIEDLRGEALKYLLSRGVVLRLSEMEKGFEARVLVVLETKPELVARLYGVGVLPGRKIRVLARGGGVYLVEVGSEGRVVALDADLAPKIMIIART